MNKILSYSLVGFLIAISANSFAEENSRAKKSPPVKNLMIEKIDANKDGVISEAEFIANAKEHFNSMDLNNDGRITPEESEASFKKMQEKFKHKKPKAE